MPKIGAHVSAAGGLYTAFENAKRIGADCIQIFGASPRQWEVRLPDKKVVEQYKTAAKKSKIQPVFLHAAYLVNLGSPNHYIRTQSVKNLIGHLKITEVIGADGLVFHLGSGKNTTLGKARKQTVAAVKAALKKVPGQAQLLMENSAGGGARVGSDIDGIAAIFRALNSTKRVKLCFDTAHAFESGMIRDYSPVEIKKFLAEWDQKIGLNNIIVIHANDSKTAYNSKHDRHENIGKGYLGLKSFKNLARFPPLRALPWILEVPGFADQGPDAKNIKILRSCF